LGHAQILFWVLGLHAQQEQAESDKAAERASERTQGEQLASSGAAIAAAAPSKDGEGKGDLLDQIISQVSPPLYAGQPQGNRILTKLHTQGTTHGSKSQIPPSVRTPTPQPPEDKVVVSNRDAVAVIKSNTFMPGANMQKQLDHVSLSPSLSMSLSPPLCPFSLSPSLSILSPHSPPSGNENGREGCAARWGSNGVDLYLRARSLI
jgi:hypothetical protein